MPFYCNFYRMKSICVHVKFLYLFRSDDWEINIEDLTISDFQLGSGAFAVVVKGTLKCLRVADGTQKFELFQVQQLDQVIV
jgi:hypothetical protein